MNSTGALAVALTVGMLLGGCGSSPSSQTSPGSTKLEHIRQQQRSKGWLEAKCSEPGYRHLHGCALFRKQMHENK